MKYSIALLLLVMARTDATAQPRKPYDGEVVRVTSTEVRGKLRYIYAENKAYRLTLSCNADFVSCEVPLVGHDYEMIGITFYSCDNYHLRYIDPHGVEHGDVACLDSATAR